MSGTPVSHPRGAILHAAIRYDAQVWLFTLGRERAFRRKILAPAKLAPGETVLDVGCGTGSLAIEAKRQVGAAGTVYGIDASPEMLERAIKKARRAGLEIRFTNAPAQALPFADGSLDVVLITLVLHHLPRSSREICVREMRRVLKPDGRVLVVDFVGADRKSSGLLRRFHRHGHLNRDDVTSLVREAALRVVDSGTLTSRLQFVLASRQSEC
jgi:ubiquinone/menaquinone biosynthesis C-methylase UbiE